MSNHAIAPGIVPPPRGLEKEEPEQAWEEDIPQDDQGTDTVEDSRLRDVEHE